MYVCMYIYIYIYICIERRSGSWQRTPAGSQAGPAQL